MDLYKNAGACVLKEKAWCMNCVIGLQVLHCSNALKVWAGRQQAAESYGDLISRDADITQVPILAQQEIVFPQATCSPIWPVQHICSGWSRLRRIWVCIILSAYSCPRPRLADKC